MAQRPTYTAVSIAATSGDIAAVLGMDVMLARAVKAQVRTKNLEKSTV